MEPFGKLKSKGALMNNLLSIVLFLSFSLGGTSYLVFGSDHDDNSDIKSFGYNHNVLKLSNFALGLGGDYSANLSGDSYFNSYDNLDLVSEHIMCDSGKDCASGEIPGLKALGHAFGGMVGNPNTDSVRKAVTTAVVSPVGALAKAMNVAHDALTPPVWAW